MDRQFCKFKDRTCFEIGSEMFYKIKYTQQFALDHAYKGTSVFATFDLEL